MKKVFIQISGPEHSKKTTLAEYVARHLLDAGVNVTVQKADPQLEDKQAKSLKELKEALSGVEVFITEMNTR